MDERMLTDFLVFLFGTTAVISATRIVLRFLETRRPVATPVPAPVLHVEERLARIEQIVESTAIEVERIAEGQRFTTKLLSDRASAGAEPRGTLRVVTPH